LLDGEPKESILRRFYVMPTKELSAVQRLRGPTVREAGAASANSAHAAEHLLFVGAQYLAGPRIDHVDLPAMNSCTGINCPQLKPEHTMAFKWTKASRAKLSRSQKARWKERKRQLRRKRPKRPSR